MDFRRSFVARSGKRIPLDFEKLFQKGDLSQNMAVEPGDYIYFAPGDLNEVYLRIAVRCTDKKEAAKLGRLFPPLALSGPPFIGGAGGMIEPRGLLGIWPTLAPRSIIEEYVRVSMEEP